MVGARSHYAAPKLGQRPLHMDSAVAAQSKVRISLLGRCCDAMPLPPSCPCAPQEPLLVVPSAWFDTG